MKKYIFAILVSLMVVGSAFAQKNPANVSWVYEDSADAKMWTISAALDFDTSYTIDVFNLPETGLGFQIYWNDADTGQLVFILQQNVLSVDRPGFASFDDSASAVTYISSWVYADSTSIGDASGRGGFVWNPTLVGPSSKARLIVGRRSGTDPREFSVAAIKEY